MGLDVIGYVATEHDQADMGDLPRLADMESFLATSQAGHCDQLWIALPMRAEDSIRRLVNAVGDAPTTIRLIPDLFGHQLLNQHATELAGIPVITLRSSRITGYARIAKAAEDRLLAALILLLISPLMLLLALGVKLSSPGPVLFRQKRHGLGGREVEVWKFRSMRLHREDDGIVTQATRHDPRVTPFGRFLRACSLDELPQFFNVLQGSMSIVGPRPHAVEHNQYYTTLVQHYMRRHHVKPGITGWAQVNGARGQTDTVEKMAMRVEYDLYYIRNWSIALDLRIIALTAIRGFFNKNAY
jgi:Undecaprenyl-phosphate glucose phosphotransferase